MGFLNILNVLVFAAAITSGSIEWNGNSIADISREHPTMITPVGYAFSIWGLIYLAVSCFLVWQLVPKNADNDYVRAATLPFAFACIAQALWAPAWCSDMVSLAMVLMLNILYHLFILACRIRSAPFLLRLPFSLWFGWITLATLISVTTLLKDILQVPYFASAAWAVTAELIAIVLAFIWSSLTRDPGYSAAVAWGLFGITQRTEATDLNVSRVALFGTVFLFVNILIVLLRLLKHKKQQTLDAAAAAKDRVDADEESAVHEDEEYLMQEVNTPVVPANEIPYQYVTPQASSTNGMQYMYAPQQYAAQQQYYYYPQTYVWPYMARQ
jgi:Na+-transporting methylmalonyl-CoA/oxaloacetate decarboxylase gamma subunit